MAADGDAVGEARDAHAERPQQAGKVHRRRLALGVRIRGHDDLFDVPLRHAVEQRLNLQIVGPHMVHRRDDAVQHVVAAVVFARALDGDDVARVGDDADDMFITLRRRADGAEAAVRQIAADGAERDGALGVDDGIGKGLGLLFGQAQHEKREPLCALAADAGQARELLNELFERRGKVFHGLNLSAL